MDERKNIYERWITPIMKCNDRVGPKNSTTYSGRPVGNSPEMMPLDNSLNQDVHESVRHHIAATFYLPNDHDDKFQLSSPKEIVRAYRRVFTPSSKGEGIPSSTRIIQDVNKMVFSMSRIKEEAGAVVEGIASHDGHRKFV